MKTVGLLVNLTQHKTSDWSAIAEETSLLAAIAALLERFTTGGVVTVASVGVVTTPSVGVVTAASGGVVEQCLCVLLNLSGCPGNMQDTLAHHQDITRLVSSVLVSGWAGLG